MTSYHPCSVLANNKNSAIMALKPFPEHGYGSFYRVKIHFNKIIALRKDIQISKTRQGMRKEDIEIRHGRALEKVKRELIGKTNIVEGLCMVDCIQRLGIEHHFQDEIDATLKRKHRMLLNNNNNIIIIIHDDYYHGNDSQELSQVSLQFRLLRQQGYNIHADIFNKFWDKNNNGKVKHEFCKDIDGLICLFEASQLRMEGEESLDEAEEFSRNYLNAWMSSSIYHPHAKFVAHTLRFPIHKTLTRFMPTTLLQFQDAGCATSLQQLSKLETQMVGSLHLKEIFAVCKWWKELGLSLGKEMKFGRDEPIKWYMWAMACIEDPRFSDERIQLTKPISLIYVIDDIFDFSASIHQLTLFTHAVNRWDLAAMEELPDYMKVCFKALYDTTNEFALKTQIKHGWNPIHSLIKSWVRLMNAFLEEAKWFASGHVPNAEEYLKNGIVSTGVEVILVHAFFFMGQGITKETVTLMQDFPTLISTTATILRLCDDLEGDKDVDGDGNDGSYLKCYMKDHPGISIEEARDHINKQISNAWKQLNHECLNPEANPLPSSFTKLCLNAARMVPLMYSYDSNSPSKLEDYVKSLLSGGGNIQSVPEDQAIVS